MLVLQEEVVDKNNPHNTQWCAHLVCVMGWKILYNFTPCSQLYSFVNIKYTTVIDVR